MPYKSALSELEQLEKQLDKIDDYDIESMNNSLDPVLLDLEDIKNNASKSLSLPDLIVSEDTNLTEDDLIETKYRIIEIQPNATLKISNTFLQAAIIHVKGHLEVENSRIQCLRFKVYQQGRVALDKLELIAKTVVHAGEFISTQKNTLMQIQSDDFQTESLGKIKISNLIIFSKNFQNNGLIQTEESLYLNAEYLVNWGTIASDKLATYAINRNMLNVGYLKNSELTINAVTFINLWHCTSKKITLNSLAALSLGLVQSLLFTNNIILKGPFNALPGKPESKDDLLNWQTLTSGIKQLLSMIFPMLSAPISFIGAATNIIYDFKNLKKLLKDKYEQGNLVMSDVLPVLAQFTTAAISSKQMLDQYNAHSEVSYKDLWSQAKSVWSDFDYSNYDYSESLLQEQSILNQADISSAINLRTITKNAAVIIGPKINSTTLLNYSGIEVATSITELGVKKNNLGVQAGLSVVSNALGNNDNNGIILGCDIVQTGRSVTNGNTLYAADSYHVRAENYKVKNQAYTYAHHADILVRHYEVSGQQIVKTGTIQINGDLKAADISGKMQAEQLVLKADHIEDIEDFVCGSGAYKNTRVTDHLKVTSHDVLHLSKAPERECELDVLVNSFTQEREIKYKKNSYIEATKDGIKIHANATGDKQLEFKAQGPITIGPEEIIYSADGLVFNYLMHVYSKEKWFQVAAKEIWDKYGIGEYSSNNKLYDPNFLNKIQSLRDTTAKKYNPHLTGWTIDGWFPEEWFKTHNFIIPSGKDFLNIDFENFIKYTYGINNIAISGFVAGGTTPSSAFLNSYKDAKEAINKNYKCVSVKSDELVKFDTQSKLNNHGFVHAPYVEAKAEILNNISHGAGTGILMADIKLTVKTKKDINNICHISMYQDTYDTRMAVTPAQLIGGIGDADGVGAEITSEEKIKNDASIIAAPGHVKVKAKGDIESKARTNQYVSFYSSKTNKTITRTDTEVAHSLIESTQGSVEVQSTEGEVKFEGNILNSHLAPQIKGAKGTEIKGVKAVSTLTCDKNSAFGLRRSNLNESHQYDVPGVIKSEIPGITNIDSSEGTTLLQNTNTDLPGKTNLTGREVHLVNNKNKHSIKQKRSNINLNIPGIDKGNHPLVDAIKQLPKSHSSNEQAVSAVNASLAALDTASNVVNAINNDTLLVEAAKQAGLGNLVQPKCSLGLSQSTTTMAYETPGVGSFNTDELKVIAENKIRIDGVPVTTTGDALLKAKIIEQNGVILEATLNHNERSASLTVDINGNQSLSANTLNHSTTQQTVVNQPLNVGGKLTVEAGKWNLKNAYATCKSFEFKVKNIDIESSVNSLTSDTFQLGVSTNGDFSIASRHHHSATVPHPSGIHSQESITPENFQVGHANLQAAAITSGGTVDLTHVNLTTHSVVLENTTTSKSIASNLFDLIEMKTDTSVQALSTIKIHDAMSKQSNLLHSVANGKTDTKLGNVTGHVHITSNDGNQIISKKSHHYSAQIPANPNQLVEKWQAIKNFNIKPNTQNDNVVLVEEYYDPKTEKNIAVYLKDGKPSSSLRKKYSFTALVIDSKRDDLENSQTLDYDITVDKINLVKDKWNKWKLTDRSLGLLQCVGGLAQTVAGAALGALTAETGIGPFFASGVATMGVDNAVAGCATAWTGSPQPTLLNRNLQSIGLNEQQSALTEISLNLCPLAAPTLVKCATNLINETTNATRDLKTYVRLRDGNLLSKPTFFHSKTSLPSAERTMRGVNPEFFNSDARFSKALYLAKEGPTTQAELLHHNAIASHTIRYTLNQKNAKILDLTQPAIAKQWGYTGGNNYALTQPIADKARHARYNAIFFRSERGKGNNLAVLDNFNDLLTPEKIIAVPKKQPPRLSKSPWYR